MKKVVSRKTLLVVLLSVFALIVIYFTLGERPQSAQQRPVEPKAKFAQFSKADAITSAIRDGSREIVKVEVTSFADRDRALKLGQVVQDFGSQIVISKERKKDMSRSGMTYQRLETSINLPGAKFDPVDQPPVETVQPGGDARPTRGYYVVQLGGIATDDWLDSLRDAGVEIIQYVPHQAFFVYGEGSAMANIAGHSRVRWVGRYLAAQKVSADTRKFSQDGADEAKIYDVAVFSNLELTSVASEVGGRIRSSTRLSNNFFNTIRVELSREELERVTAIEGVFRIDPYIPPTAEDERSSQIIAGNYTSTTSIAAPGYNPLTQFGADGTGVTVMVSDDGISIPGNGGFYLTSANTVDGPLRGATAGASGGHGHLNASIIAGSTPFGALDPLGYNYGLGVAPKANIINIPFLKTGNTTGDAQAVDDALTTLGPNGVRASISNNSWGAGTNGNSYESLAAIYDGLVRDGSLGSSIDPFSIIFSAGNSGPGALSLTRPKVSKNTIVVANSENIRTEFTGTGADNMDDLRSSSSRGLAADGRIKPDITAPGTVIAGSRAGTCGSVTSCFDANHAWSTGTSHAAPQVAGAAALFTNYWRGIHMGATPPPSLIKAAIINSAQEMNGFETGAAIPNGNEGWGRMNMKIMMGLGAGTILLPETHVFQSPGASVGSVYRVADVTKPIRISLVWTDPPAAVDPALVNNLDLTVTVNGNVYRGNVFSGGLSTTGGTGDAINNVENVFLPAGTPAGAFITISVSASALNGDGVLGNADTTDQNFSLVLYNIGITTVDAHPPADFDGDGKTDVSIFRPSVGEWWYSRSSNGSTYAAQFGVATDKLVPADYTGDGKADIAIWRPSTGELFVLRSEDSSFFSTTFGTSTDTFVAGDYDNDNKADVAVFRPSTGTWFIQKSSGGIDIVPFGVSTDLPVPSDYDGDGKTDIAIFRPSNGQWWINRSANGVVVYEFGVSTDRLVPGDYTGDGNSDVAFWRPSTGSWFVLRSENNSFYSVPFGANGDVPTPGDYDGDGKFDTAVFRAGTWFVDHSASGTVIQNFGLPTDTPVPNAFVR